MGESVYYKYPQGSQFSSKGCPLPGFVYNFLKNKLQAIVHILTWLISQRLTQCSFCSTISTQAASFVYTNRVWSTFSALELAQYVSFQNILGWRPQRHAGSKCSYRLISVISVGARPASGFSICWLQFDGRTCHIAKASGFSNRYCDEVLGCAGKCPHRKETHHNMLLNLIVLWAVFPRTHSKSAW